MRCYQEAVTMMGSGGTMRKRPRPKMKASKKRRSSIGNPVLNKSKNVSPQPQNQNAGFCETEVKQNEREEPKEQLYDDPVVCIFCDDGGDNILSCEGQCHRHFHANKEDGETACQTLGFSPEMVKSIDPFICENCKHEMHQCFICGELGSSTQSQREVYMCHVQSCKKFYHLHCILKLRGIAHGTHYVKQIMKGNIKLFCPRHRCDTCKTEDFSPGKLVQCRRCPKAWHADCLKDFENSGELETREIWQHDRFKYIYCRKHEILPDLETPTQDHVKFPSCQ